MIKQIKKSINYYNLVKDIDIQKELEDRGLEGRISGNNFMTSCPFHEESNPSFGVRITEDKKGLFKCFSCGETGNFFNLISHLDGIEFDKAVNKYQRNSVDVKYLMELKTFFENNLTEKKKKRNNKIKTYKISFLKKFQKPYGEYLEYLHKRKIKDETIEKFNLLCCDGIEGKGYSKKWKDRIVIPIIDENNKLIGCTARHIYFDSSELKVRKIKNSEPHKYCFGIKWIRKGSPLILVEGDLDMIYLQQNNIPAICVGKFQSNEQIKTIINFTDKVVLSLDGDVEWKNKKNPKNSLSYIRKRLSKFMKVNTIKLPYNKDPNDLNKKEVKKYYSKYINKNYFS